MLPPGLIHIPSFFRPSCLTRNNKEPNIHFCFTRCTEDPTIFLPLQTKFTNSILFYASAEHPERQFLAVTLTDANTMYVEVNFGSGAVGEEIGRHLNHMTWNTLTLVHQHDTIQVSPSGVIVSGQVRCCY